MVEQKFSSNSQVVSVQSNHGAFESLEKSENHSDQDVAAQYQSTVKPIFEIFICFGQEEIFEGDLTDALDAGNFDIIELVAGDNGAEDNQNSDLADLGVTTVKEKHTEAVLSKRKQMRAARAR